MRYINLWRDADNNDEIKAVGPFDSPNEAEDFAREHLRDTFDAKHDAALVILPGPDEYLAIQAGRAQGQAATA